MTKRYKALKDLELDVATSQLKTISNIKKILNNEIFIKSEKVCCYIVDDRKE